MNQPTMTEAQATNEAVLLLTRKLRRMDRAAYDRVFAALPDGAKTALNLAEMDAEKLRDSEGGPAAWPMTSSPDSTTDPLSTHGIDCPCDVCTRRRAREV